MDLSVITVTWNSADLIPTQIMSVRNGCKNISFEQLIADNASTDDTVKIIEELQNVSSATDSHPRGNDYGIKLIKNNFNTGFGFPNNQCAKISHGDFLLFLNPDMRVSEGGLDKMVAWMRERPDVGLASCKLTDQNGNVNEDAVPRRWPGVWDQLAIIFKLPHLFPRVLDKYLYKNFDADKEQEVDSVRGSFMLMRREVYEKLGWAFDPRYFIWFEDVDTCREVKRLGFKVVYTPIISCVDYIGQSFKQRTTLWKQKHFTESMLQYFKKWEPWHKWVWIAAARPIGMALVWLNEKYTE